MVAGTAWVWPGILLLAMLMQLQAVPEGYRSPDSVAGYSIPPGRLFMGTIAQQFHIRHMC